MWTVTRQNQWPDGNLVVEVSSGGIDYCNPGAYCRKYPGEMEEYQNPQEAVEVAIAIARQWKADTGKDIHLGSGATGGYTMPFDPMPLTIETYNLLRHNAKVCYLELPKCAQCGDLLGKERFGDHNMGEYECCSEYCAEKYYFTPCEDDLIEA